MIFPVFAGVSALLAAYYVFLIAATRPVRENGSGPEEQAEGISVITVGRNAIDNLRFAHTFGNSPEISAL